MTLVPPLVPLLTITNNNLTMGIANDYTILHNIELTFSYFCVLRQNHKFSLVMQYDVLLTLGYQLHLYSMGVLFHPMEEFSIMRPLIQHCFCSLWKKFSTTKKKNKKP